MMIIIHNNLDIQCMGSVESCLKITFRVRVFPLGFPSLDWTAMAHRKIYSSRRSRPQSTGGLHTVKITGLSETVTEHKLRKFIEQQSAGRGLVDLRVFGEQRYALINYSRETSVERVCSKLNGKHLNGSAVSAKVKGATPAATEYFTVKINHLPRGVGEQELRDICSRCGIVTSVKLNEGYGYVNFSDLASARNAVDYLDKLTFSHGQKISAKMHQPHHQEQVLTEPQIPVHMSSIGTSSNSYAMSSSTSRARPPPSSQSTQPSLPIFSTVKVELSCQGLSGNDLLHYFMKFGNVEGVPVILSGNPDYAYVNFSNSGDAERACKVAKVQLKEVTLTIKLSKKPRISASVPKMDTLSFSTGDFVVDGLLAKHCFDEIEGKLTSFNVTIQPIKASGGLQVTGDQVDVFKAKVLLDEKVAVLKTMITKKSNSFPCSTIPFLSDPELFQHLQQKHSTEFAVVRSDGSEEKLVLFCATISSYSKKSTPMKLAFFDDYFHIAAGSTRIPFWCFQDDLGNFAKMSTKDSKAVEHLYQSFTRKIPYTSSFMLAAVATSKYTHCIGKFEYVYDFSRMVQENVSTRKIRPLKRSHELDSNCSREITIQCRGIKENVTTSLQALREAVDKASTTMNVKVENFEDEMLKVAQEYCVDVQQTFPGTLSLKGETKHVREVNIYLKETIVKARSCAALPVDSGGPYWEPQSDQIEIKDVALLSKEGQEIQREFRKSLSSSQVTKIQRIQNKWLWEKYSFCRQRMSSKNGRSGVNEMRLFHGSSRTPPESIYRSDFGFDFRFSSPGKWGKGAYFASDSNYSNSYAYNNSYYGKQMFLAYVLTGNSVTHPGSPSLDKPPLKPLSTGERYDSVTNGNVGGTQIFVVYDHDKSYPAYIITYN